MQRRQLQINEGHAAADIKEKKRQKIYRIKNYVVVPVSSFPRCLYDRLYAQNHNTTI